MDLKMRTVLFIACLLLCACSHADASDITMAVQFVDGEGRCTVGRMEEFGAFRSLIASLGRESVVAGSVALPTTKAVFERVLALCSADQAPAGDLDRGALCDILQTSNFLDISDSGRRRLFFRNVASRGLLGAHSSRIFGPAAAPAMPSDVNFLSGNTFLGLFGGLADALGMEVRILGDTATVCIPDYCPAEYGCRECIDVISSVSKVRIPPPARAFIECSHVWEVAGWLFRNMLVTSLSLKGCRLQIGDIRRIAGLGLEELDVSMCDLGHGELVPLGESASSARTTLRRLSASNNDIDCRDMAAILSLELEALDISGSTIQPFSAPGSDDCVARGTLRKLNVSSNRLGALDIAVMAGFSLERLVIHNCGLRRGSLAALSGEDSVLKSSLRRLNVSWNEMGAEDMRSLSGMRLEEIDAHNCYLGRGDLAPIGREGSVLRETLRRLNVSYNRLGFEDSVAVASLGLESLAMESSDLYMRSFRPFKEGRALRATLCELQASWNRMSAVEMKSITNMGLRELTLCHCRLVPRDLLPFGDSSSALWSTLRRLNVSGNTFDREDMDAISCLGLEELRIRDCSLVVGSLVPLGRTSSLLRSTLRSLDGSHNSFGAEDMSAIAVVGLRSLVLRGCSFPSGSLALLLGGGSLRDTLSLIEIPSTYVLSDEDKEVIPAIRNLKIV